VQPPVTPESSSGSPRDGCGIIGLPPGRLQLDLDQGTNAMDATGLGYRALLRRDLDAVHALLLSSCREIPEPIRRPIEMLVNGGGKRLRPALVLLSSSISGAKPEEAYLAAAAVELLHTATLIHDDLIDQAAVRRGVTTLNAHWAPTVSVLAGDIVFALAAKLMGQTRNPALVEQFAATLETICLGELQQMLSRNCAVPTAESYYARIFAKTASLFALCMRSGPVLAGCSELEVERASQIGRLLGESFQIVDDVLDLFGDSARLGKPVGADLRQGIVTLPVLLYAQDEDHGRAVEHALHQQGDVAALDALLTSIRGSGVAELATAAAQERAEAAMDLIRELPASPHRHALEEMARFSVQRTY
jgi:octaprenyl-diphosphate synthase